MIDTIRVIVPGGLNTDIIATNLPHLPQEGEDVFADEVKIGPGGKSRNIAQMIATLSSKKTVAMVGRTSKDPYGLWKLPYDALQNAGVNTDYIHIVDFTETSKFPGIALVAVDIYGNRNASVLLGTINDFSFNDIDRAEKLFFCAQKNNGVLALSLEMPFKTAMYAIKKAVQYGLRVILDPGGMREANADVLLDTGAFLIKPNEHEAYTLTGIKIKDITSAQKAADKLIRSGYEHVFITHGASGGYFFDENKAFAIPIPQLPPPQEKDATGCGDQVMAALCAGLISGKNLEDAVKESIIAGTLQFRKLGVQPVTRKELDSYLC